MTGTANSRRRLAARLVLATALVAGPLAAPAYAVNCGRNPTHPQCDNGGTPDRIAGCASFTAGNAVRGDGDPFCDGDLTVDPDGNAATMQVAMNCQFNHFNLYVGGGDALGRHIVVELDSPIDTLITSCVGPALPITFQSTETVGAGIDCGASGNDWGFWQHLRASADATNVCDLRVGDDPLGIPMRFQTHLIHHKTCKGGANKCGENFEAIDIDYGSVTITCTAEDDASQCTEWIVAGDSAVLTHDEGTGDGPITLPFEATFSPQ
jgi:hypothetical protein